MDCNDSSMILEGQTWVQHYANIEVLNVYDTNNGRIAITPLGKAKEYHTVYQGQTVHTDTNDYNISVLVKSIFYGSTGIKGMSFDLCWEPKYTPPVMCSQEFRMQDQNNNPINGNVQIGTTAMTVIGSGVISLEQGKSYTAVASFSDKPTQSKTFTACTGPIIFTFEVETIGTLNCYSVPTGATILIDGVSHGVTDKENIELMPGIYDVILRKSGYDDVYKEVTIVLGVAGIIRVDLTAVCPIPTITGILTT